MLVCSLYFKVKLSYGRVNMREDGDWERLPLGHACRFAVTSPIEFTPVGNTELVAEKPKTSRPSSAADSASAVRRCIRVRHRSCSGSKARWPRASCTIAASACCSNVVSSLERALRFEASAVFVASPEGLQTPGDFTALREKSGAEVCNVIKGSAGDDDVAEKSAFCELLLDSG